MHERVAEAIFVKNHLRLFSRLSPKTTFSGRPISSDTFVANEPSHKIIQSRWFIGDKVAAKAAETCALRNRGGRKLTTTPPTPAAAATARDATRRRKASGFAAGGSTHALAIEAGEKFAMMSKKRRERG